MTDPTPLSTILHRNTAKFAAAVVENGKIVSTVGYAMRLDECYFLVQGCRSWYNYETIIMAELKEIGDKNFWCAV